MSQQSSTVQSKSTTASHKPASPTPGPVPLTPEQQQQVGGAGDRTGLPKGGW